MSEHTLSVSCADARPARGDAAWMIAPTPLSTSVKSSVTMSFISTTSAFATFRASKNVFSCSTFAPRAALCAEGGQLSYTESCTVYGQTRWQDTRYARADGVASLVKLDEDVRAYEPGCAGDLPVSGSFHDAQTNR